MIEKMAKVIRVATVPPVMVAGLLMILYVGRDDVFSGGWQLFWGLFFLMGMPLLAYPLSYIIPEVRSKGREGQRNLAFVFSFLGYGSGLIYALLSHVNSLLLIVFLTYVLSVVILTIFNSGVKIKASGHACSIAGPLTIVIYFLGIKSLLWCVMVLALVIASSLVLKRHTLGELLFGSAASVMAFFVSAVVLGIYGP